MKKRLKYRGSSAPFTLVELLVVIAIIGVLASMLLPALQAAKQSAVSTDCMNRYRQMGLAIFQYQGEHDGYYPVNWLPEFPGMDFLTQMQPYVDPASEGDTAADRMWNAKKSVSENLWLCPASDYQPGYSSTHIYANWATISSWRVHNYFLNVHFGWHNLSVYPAGNARREFDAPAEKMAMMGEIYGANKRWPRYDARWFRVNLFRHPGESTNMLMRDGHVINAGNYSTLVSKWRNGDIITRPSKWW